MTHQVVVSGIGAITPIGNGISDFYRNAIAGRCGVERVRFSRPFRSELAALCSLDEEWLFSPSERRYLSRPTKLALAAAGEAWADAGLSSRSGGEDAGCYVGSSIGGAGEMQAFLRAYCCGPREQRDVLVVSKSMESAPAAHVAMRYGLQGPNFTINTACSSGTQAIGVAYEGVRSGVVRRALCGGVDALDISEPFWDAWNNLRILSPRNDAPQAACRPFSASRSGTVLGEGSAFLVLERLSDAKARGNRPYAEIVGYAATCDALNLITPRKETQALALRWALERSGLDRCEIGHVNAHGTGTKLNDEVEAQLLAEYFGEQLAAVSVTATKSLVGHAMGAAGAIEAAITAYSLREGVLHPTINCEDPDPACPIPIISSPTPLAARGAVSLSYGMGGNNAALVLCRMQGVT